MSPCNISHQNIMKAFIETNHYCPRPVLPDSNAQYLWKIFSPRYIFTSPEIFRGASLPDLATLFIPAVVDELTGPYQRRQPGGSGLPPANEQRDRNRRGKEQRVKEGR